MRIIKSLDLAFNIFVHSKLRSWLTIIGIVIGIGAVVAIVSISEGAKQDMEERLGSLGADILTISSGASRAMGAGGDFRGGPPEMGGGESSSSSSSSESKNLTKRDVLVLKSLSNVIAVMGTVSGKGDMTYSGKTASVNVQGVDTSAWKDITTEEVDSGRLLTQADKYTVVIGNRLATETFKDGIPLNSKVTIEGKSFTVVGITTSGSSVYMPIDIARDTLEDVGEEEMDSISVKIEDVDISDETVDAITEKLMLSRGILYETEKDFSVSNPSDMQETMTETLNTISLFLGAIAAISLVVGGVGIANTMFTSVLEKTRDIGIMKAIGAKNRDVLLIFLFNSGLIGLVGGIGGIVLGAVASSLIGSYGGITSSSSTEGMGRGGMMNMFSSTAITPELLIEALLFAMVIGVVAGAIPAYRASRLNPVDALRYE